MDTGAWQRLASELEQLLDCTPHEREKRLEQLQREDPELASRLRAALDADTRGFALVDEPIALRLEPVDDVPAPAFSHASAGDQVGPWRLLRELGQGGMGHVWLASRDDGQYQLEVAIKLIDGVLDSGLMREQLRRERQILADLDHPNIARLLDGGIRDDGTPWYAMEYVCGLPLDQYCEQHALSLQARLRLLAGVAQAVQHAHARLVVHRDLKPGNILVDEEGVAHLLDFGIAKLLDAGGVAPCGPLTLLAAATPAYAAPEQLRGEQVDTAADIYALGAIAFELLAGKRAPQAGLQFTDAELGPKPSRFIQDRRQRAAVRGDMDAIVSQALAPRPTDRYASAQAMADDILRHLDGLPVAARGAGTGYRARKFVRRHWLGVGLGTAAVLLLLVALVFSVRQTRRAQVELARANAVQQFLLGVFGAAQPAPGGSFVVTQRDLANRAIGLLDKQLAGQSDAAVDVLVAVGRVYRKMGFGERSRAVLHRALAELDRLPNGDHDPRRVDALLALGRANFLSGNFSAATDHLRQADRLASALHHNAATHAAILYELGSSLSARRHIAEATAVLGHAETLARADPQAAMLLPKILLEKALTLRRAHRIEAAIGAGRKALAAARTTYGDEDVRTAGSLSTVGGMLRRAGQLHEAEAMLRQAEAIERDVYGEPQAATINNLATVLQDRGHTDESGALFRQALELAVQRYGADGITTASYRRNLALEQADAGQIDAALANMRKAYARYSEGNPPGSPGNLEMRAQLARVLYQAGRPEEAGNLLPEILADATKHSQTALVPLREARMLSARLALDAGNLRLAGEQLQAADRDLQPHGLGTPDMVRLRLLAGDLALARGKPIAAHRAWQSALDLAQARLGPGHTLARDAARRLPR
ncbi:MAG: tetratricopeptide repeat protein [Rhodanobacteraceae bacterium]